jgi:hypothetical protein
MADQCANQADLWTIPEYLECGKVGILGKDAV